MNSTETKFITSILESASKSGAAYRTKVTINGERYTLIDRRAHWRKKFDSVNDKS